jgi:cobalt/nickel transport system ATP-binding protein
MTPNGHALFVSGLRYSYPDGPEALGGVDLTVEPGEKVGIVGPNGAGKTTFFHSLCGVLKTEGEALLFGEKVEAGRFRAEIGMVFQNPDDQLFSPSVREDVAFGPRNMGLSKEEVEGRVSEAMATTGVSELSRRAPHHLSGGEKRMVSIAGVLAMRPSLIVYDEPSANLDIRSRRRLIEFLQNTDHTILISSHDLELVLEVCDRVVLMDDGKVVADGEPRSIMSDEELMDRHGLEKPHSLVPHAEYRESR